MNVVKAVDVIRVLHKAAETYGYPAAFLATTVSSSPVGAATVWPKPPSTELFALGIEARHSHHASAIPSDEHEELTVHL
jgi:hypothetical protein